MQLKIVQLTASVLTLHMEYTTTQTLNTDVRNYKYVLDYYYTKIISPDYKKQLVHLTYQL